jgi:muramoyltetrapeptide carboxypeptidase
MPSIQQPPALKKGDTIALVCPAGHMPIEKTKGCQQTLASWGFKVKVGKTVGHQFHYFSGTDEERLQDLQQMLDDPQVNAILCARGGYGCSRIVDKIDWRQFKKHPKWIIGFSDVTVLHSTLYTKLKMASLHAPMANAFNDGGAKEMYVDSLKKALTGKKNRYQVNANDLNRKGTGSGVLLGGNLSLLAHLLGTPSDINTKGAILFVEDVGEFLYNVDRMLLQLDRAGKLKHLAGLVFGGFTDNKDTNSPFGKTIEEILFERIAGYSFPVCFGFPVSHEKENVALKVGANYELKVGTRVSLKER